MLSAIITTIILSGPSAAGTSESPWLDFLEYEVCDGDRRCLSYEMRAQPEPPLTLEDWPDHYPRAAAVWSPSEFAGTEADGLPLCCNESGI